MGIRMRLCLLLLAFTLLAVLRSGADTPTAVETQLGELIRTNAAQHRVSMTWDPVLHAVARARANSMATRRYFDHLDPDGYCANRLLQLAGYTLPAFWGAAPDTNYIESIAAGMTGASAVFTSWMNSPGHRAHIMAENPGYRDQIRYGVAHVELQGSPFRHYYVFMSAPEPPGGPVALAPYVSWQLRRFTARQIDEGGDETDDSGDGLGRIVKFALGMDPFVKNRLPDPAFNAAAQRLEWVLPLIADLGDVQAKVERSTSLTAWTADGVERSGNQFRLPTTGGSGYLRLQVKR